MKKVWIYSFAIIALTINASAKQAMDPKELARQIHRPYLRALIFHDKASKRIKKMIPIAIGICLTEKNGQSMNNFVIKRKDDNLIDSFSSLFSASAPFDSALSFAIEKIEKNPYTNQPIGLIENIQVTYHPDEFRKIQILDEDLIYWSNFYKETLRLDNITNEKDYEFHFDTTCTPIKIGISDITLISKGKYDQDAYIVDKSEVSGSKNKAMLYESIDNANKVLPYTSIYKDDSDLLKDIIEISKTSRVKVAVLDNGIDINHPLLARHIPRINENSLDQVALEKLKTIEKDQENLNRELKEIKDTFKKEYIFEKINVLKMQRNEIIYTNRIGLIKGTGMGFLGLPRAPKEHGTHVAGILTRKTNLIEIIPVETTYYLGEMKGEIAKAVDQGAKIINMSFRNEFVKDQGFIELNQSIWINIFSTHQRVLFISSAGNEGIDITESNRIPSTIEADNQIVIANVDHDGLLSPDSNYSKTLVHFAAYGVNIESTFPNGEMGILSGTSMAAPFVSRIAAKILSLSDKFTPEDVKSILCKTVTYTPQLFELTKCGGIVNEKKAIEYAQEYIKLHF
jgi:hypothetical protein